MTKAIALVLVCAGIAFGQLGTIGGGSRGTPLYEAAFSATDTVAVTGATHGKGVNPVVEKCENSSGASLAFTVARTAANGNITITLSAGAATGSCWISDGKGGNRGPTGLTGGPGDEGPVGSSSQPAWADAADGTGCTLTSPTGKTYIAFLVTATDRGSLTCSDYDEATWTQFKGDSGPEGDPGTSGNPGPPGCEYSNTFTGTSSTVNASTHGCGTNPKIEIRASGGSDISRRICSWSVDGSGNVTISCAPSVTNARYIITGGTPATGNTAATAGFLLYELGANGSDYSGIYARDSITSSWCISLPLVAPTTGQVLTATGSTVATTDGKTCVVMEWQ
jgi:hypothetical protein